MKKAEVMVGILRNFDNYDWITVILVFVLCLLALIHYYFPERSYRLFGVFSPSKFLVKRERTSSELSFFDYGILLVHLLIVALGLYYLVLSWGLSNDPSLLLYIKVFLLYAVFVLSKVLLDKIMGELFALHELADKYVFFKLSYKNLLAICLFPVLVLLTYTWNGGPKFFEIGGGIFLSINFLFLFYFYRKVLKKNYLRSFYYILYLCTLEIAPYYILYEAIISKY